MRLDEIRARKWLDARKAKKARQDEKDEIVGVVANFINFTDMEPTSERTLGGQRDRVWNLGRAELSHFDSVRGELYELKIDGKEAVGWVWNKTLNQHDDVFVDDSVTLELVNELIP